ncbi:hypothetical protein Lal_00001879 [Lupinus albus]|uniref:Uncharacterized protein n=1 Tax=Lupinus albus TaxID=3870 RepID=A0A6A5P8F5_LUPAL|nr:hypothetical protein Lalb_Chr11g0061201 [Lupinus albus]KAF1893408.1 hypothetical protein Lal_00001879 [Lupinus albus]
MLENHLVAGAALLSPPPPSSSDSNSTNNVIKRYAPPNQRNRSTHRRKSSDRLDRTNSAGSDLDKNQVASLRNAQLPDQGDAGISNLPNENHYLRFVALEGCSCSAASQLLTDRWTAAMQSYNNSTDSSEKPVMYSGGTPVWNQFRLPHQIMSPAASASSSVPLLDFLGELCRQMQC